MIGAGWFVLVLSVVARMALGQYRGAAWVGHIVGLVLVVLGRWAGRERPHPDAELWDEIVDRVALQIDEVVETARRIARRAHAGQADKSGAAYIAHPARVAAAVAGNPIAEAVAWLHDVVEDTGVTLDDLRAAGMPEQVVEAVDAITRRAGEQPEAYYGRVKANALALTVKLVDIADNSSPARLAKLDDATRARLVKKYEKAVVLLS